MELVKQVLESGGFIALLLVFVALPYLYLSLAAEAHKDCLEYRKVEITVESSAKDDPELKSYIRNIGERIDANSRVFELDWWVLASLAVVMIGVFQLPELASLSRHMPQVCTEPALEANCVMTSVTAKNVNLRCERSGRLCEDVKTVFVLYTLMVGILIGFRLWWARIAIARDIHYLYSRRPSGIVRLT